MSTRSKRQQLSAAYLRSKGLTPAKAKNFAVRQGKIGQPVIAAVALAGIVLMGASEYATVYVGPDAEASSVGTPQASAALSIDVPQTEPQQATATQDVAPSAKPQVLFFDTPTFDTAPIDWEQASYTAIGAAEENLEAPEPQNTGPDCVDTLRGMARETVIFFAPDSAQPIETDIGALLRLNDYAHTCRDAKIIVEGHSDESGTASMTLELSWQRADTTMDLLRTIDADTSRFETIGHGARLPFAQGSAGEGDINHRVEFNVRRLERE